MDLLDVTIVAIAWLALLGAAVALCAAGARADRRDALLRADRRSPVLTGATPFRLAVRRAYMSARVRPERRVRPLTH
jgi:hypothetical protein